MTQEATTDTNPFTEELEKYISASLDKWHVPSFALAVVDGDNVYSRAYGYATLPDVKATPETLYFAASTTKAHLGAVLSHLIHSKEYPQLEKGWETTISSIIPDDFVLADEWLTQNLTLEDAICHRTGTAAHDDAWFSERDGKHVSLRDTVRSQRHFPKGWQPRYKYQYNNMMYATLSHVVEVLTGKPLAEVFRTILWEPLGMHSTFLSPKDAQGSPNHLATGYYFDPETSQHKALPVPDFTQCSGAGAIISNAHDYAKWVKCLFSKGAPLSDEVHEDIRKPRMIATTSPSQGQDVRLYAAGWYRSTMQGHVLYRHAGGTDSTITQVLFLPDHGYGVVMFSNDAEGGNGITLDVLFKLVCDKLSIPSDKRPDMDAMIAGWLASADKDHEVGTVIKTVYPNAPETPEPSPVAIGDLCGTYDDAAFGRVTLVEQPDSHKSGATMLTAERPGMVWKSSFRLHHVTGTQWVLFIDHENPRPAVLGHFQGAEFQIDEAGKVTGFKVDWKNWGDKSSNGVTTFVRI